MRRGVVVIVLGLVLAAAWLVYALYEPYQGFPQEGVFVDVPRGASERTIARRLAEKGVVRSRIAFEVLCRWRAKRPLQAGEYFFDHPVNALDVFQTLAEGRVYELTVVVPEGANKFEIAALLEREGLAGRQAFLEVVGDSAPIRDLVPGARSLEGFLFPATYHLPHHITPQEIVGAMTRRFREAWASLPEASRNRNGLPIDAVVTLASLVERETPLPEERPVVAGVFANRLRRGLALQCDPTVVYALELAGKYNSSLDARGLNFDSPYNTYRHAGLPPGPIANPGEASLRAALDPAPVDYLYFVANTQGGHFFSKTLEEHNRNVARYRRLLAQNHPGQNGNDRPPETPPKKRNPKRSP
jgi:UPF0755 protein